MCGFSAQTAGILDQLVAEYTTVNVLDDNDIREGIKAFSNWPTIPQLYVDSEFLGGCDLVNEAFHNGELFEALGMDVPTASTPVVTATDDALRMIGQAVSAQPAGMAVFLSIDADWNHRLNLQQPTGKEITAQVGDVILHMDPLTAQRANGLSIELQETPQGTSFRMSNPNQVA
jgi:monothiol glutaredoxin